MHNGGEPVLPDERFGGNLGAEIAGDRPHVAMGQFEPGPGKGIGKGFWIRVKAAGDRLVERIYPEGDVGGEHDRGVPLRRIVGIGDNRLGGGIGRDPLMGTGRAFGQLPVVAEEHLKVARVPGGWRRGPGAFEAAGDRVVAAAGAVAIFPAEALCFEGRSLRLGADMARGGSAVGLAEGVAAGHEGDGLFVVHRHPGERLADVAG